MGPGAKKCQDCHKMCASAKKICVCGYVFLERKKRGFTEMPIVITPDRLRSSRLQELESRPVRVKKHKYHGSDFIYSGSADEQRNNLLNVNMDVIAREFAEQQSKIDVKFGEKLYPRRDRTKTTKYEDNFSKQQLGRSLSVSSNNSEVASTSRMEGSTEQTVKISNEKDTLIQNHMPVNEVIKNEYGISGDTKEFKTKDNNKQETYLMSMCNDEYNSRQTIDYTAVAREKIVNGVSDEIDNSENEMDVGGRFIKKIEIIEDEYESEESLDTSKEMLIKDFNMAIDIVAVEDKELPLPCLLPQVEDYSMSECESVISEDNVRLKRIRIPRNIRKFLEVGKRTSPEIDDIPLSKLIKNGNFPLNGPVRIGKDGRLKRPVGRPRKHPLIINKIKRPVGRPKKLHSPKEQNGHLIIHHNGEQKKPRRGRPPANAPTFSFGVYAEHYYYDDDEDGDDEADPDYKSPNKVNASSSVNRPERPGRRCFLSPPQLMACAKMERMRNELLETESDRWRKRLTKRHAFDIPQEKKELYSHVLKEINRRILSQAFSCTL